MEDTNIFERYNLVANDHNVEATLTEEARQSNQANKPMPEMELRQGLKIYTKPTLRISSENPSGKLGSNACCNNC